jgi:transcriptional regulator with XRE-family HTH domain
MLLAAGLSQTQISRRIGLSRRTIARIAAQGRRRLTAEDIHDDRPAGFDRECLNRCGGCGSRIYLWPCLVCELRAKGEAREETRRLVKSSKSHPEARRHGEDQERPQER